MVTYQDIVLASQRIAHAVQQTPVLQSRTLNQLLGAQVFFKCENFQRTGACKFRGAYHALSQLTAQQRQQGVVAYSAGNHAQAVALAARLHDSPAWVLMPKDAPQVKVMAARGYGAQLLFYDRYTEDRDAISADHQQQYGLSLIPPSDHPAVIAGQGTVALELFAQTGELDLLLVGVGGGGLVAGCAVAAAQLSPQCTVIGVEPQAGNHVQQSLALGRVVHIAPPKTIADGARSQSVGEYTFALMQRYVKHMVTVTDASLVAGMVLLLERMKILIEPTGCLGLAAALEHQQMVAGKRVGIILSGGNVGAQQLGQLLQHYQLNG